MATINRKGGTFVGFIAGLITGLVIAVVIAFMVTKTPIPFSGRKDKAENAPAPATVTQVKDPNQSLYNSKDSSRTASSTAVAPAPTTIPPQAQSAPAPAPVSTPPAATTTRPQQSASAKSATTQAVQQPTQAASVKPSPSATTAAQQKSTTTDEKTLYYLQTGAFKNKSEAENMKGNLALLGFESQISEAKATSGTIYRVRLGPYKVTAVTSAQKRLKQSGIPSTIMRSPKS